MSSALFGQWRSGSLFDCSRDASSCCLACWCPCVSYARVGEYLLGQDACSCFADCAIYTATCCIPGIPCLLGMTRREHLRRKFSLPPAPCNDCCVHCCCHLCAMCQEHREMRFYAMYGFKQEHIENDGVRFAAERPLLDVSDTKPLIIHRDRQLLMPPHSDANESDHLPPLIPMKQRFSAEQLKTMPAYVYLYVAGAMISVYGAISRRFS